MVEPPPINGSSTVPMPSGSEARTICRMNAWGLSDGCGASARSSRRVGAERMISSNGWSGESRLRPPVFHFRKLSCTRPSQGFRKSPQGSQLDRGITVTSADSPCAFLGRSPPRSVFTSRMISPRFSKPASIIGTYTRCESNGLVAMKRSEEHTSELQSRLHLVCRLLLEKKKKKTRKIVYEATQDTRDH